MTNTEKSNAIRLLQAPRDAENEYDHHTWSNRYRYYMATMDTGNLTEIIKMFRSLDCVLEPSFGERKLTEQAWTFISKELTIEEN